MCCPAGLEAQSRSKKPVKPHMFVLLPRPKLKKLLYRGILLHHQVWGGDVSKVWGVGVMKCVGLTQAQEAALQGHPAAPPGVG